MIRMCLCGRVNFQIRTQKSFFSYLSWGPFVDSCALPFSFVPYLSRVGRVSHFKNTYLCFLFGVSSCLRMCLVVLYENKSVFDFLGSLRGLLCAFVFVFFSMSKASVGKRFLQISFEKSWESSLRQCVRLRELTG